jgi:hypothetical protein
MMNMGKFTNLTLLKTTRTQAILTKGTKWPIAI